MHLGVIAACDALRLKEEGITEPKPLIKVLGKTLLERVLIIAEKYGFDSCNIIINEKFREEIEKSLVLETHKEAKINCIFKSTPSSLHSLYELKSFLSGDSFCLLTIDSIFIESEFAEFLKLAKAEESIDGLIAVTRFVDDEKPLWVKTDRNNRILGFDSLQNSSEYVTGGIYYFKKGIIEYTEEALSKNIFRLRNFLQYLIDMRVNLKAVPFSKIIDVDHKRDLIEAEKFLKQTETTS
ncbi:MAG: NDP-sugar synthase [Ignavibacteriae bacterium]|nr:NDP-sugar synthase [Ignavibacteriota bacterium]